MSALLGEEEDGVTDEEIEESSELLYFYLHRRYIQSRQGMAVVAEMYKRSKFGVCPRYLCKRTPVLPIGYSDLPGRYAMKIFCPCCADVYRPASVKQNEAEGCAFGTTFPHLFFLSYPHLIKFRQSTLSADDHGIRTYIPKIFGFKVHPTAQKDPSIAFIRKCCNRFTYCNK